MSLGTGINLITGFDVNTNKPLDARTVAVDATERDAIPETSRYEYMKVITSDDGKEWQLQGGVTNANWVELTSGGGDTAKPSVLGEVGVSNQLVSEESTALLNFNATPIFNNESMTWDVSNSKIMVPSDGEYEGTLSLRVYKFDGGQEFEVRIQKNGTTIKTGISDTATFSNIALFEMSFHVMLTTTDEITVLLVNTQIGGGNCNVISNSTVNQIYLGKK